MDYMYEQRKNKNNNNYGVITEQGDLGLGFEVLNESEQKAVEKMFSEDNNKK